MNSELRERVTFQAPNRVSNGRGGYTIDDSKPVAIGTFWAKVQIKSRALATLYKGERLESNVFITIRDNPAIFPGCEALHKGRRYKITENPPAEKAVGYTRLGAEEVIK